MNSLPLLWRRALVACILLTNLLGVNLLSAATRVSCVGDSITAGFGSNPYPNQLQALLGSSYVVSNFGVPGATLLTGLSNSYTSTSQYPASLNSTPNIVVIMLGTNDANGPWEANSARYVGDYLALINAYKNLSTQPTVYVAFSPKSYFYNPDTLIQTEVVPLQRLVAKLAGCQFIENYYATDNMQFNYADILHPNASGHAVLAKTVYDVLRFGSTSANFSATNVNGTENLNGTYNRNAIHTEGTAYASSGGIDGLGHSYSANLLVPFLQSVAWGNLASFEIGNPNHLNGVSNKTIPLPNGRYGAIRLLGAGVNGLQPNRSFTVNYVDGAETKTVSLSDWTSTASLQAGESLVLSMPRRTLWNGGTQTATTRVYGYTLSINNQRTLSSITLPANQNVVILGIAVDDAAHATMSPPIGGKVAFKASNASWVSAQAFVANNPLYAIVPGVNAWEKYDVISAGNGLVALRSNMNNGYVAPTAESSDASAPLNANGGASITNATKFAWINNHDGTVSLQPITNGKFVTVDLATQNRPLKASATRIQSTEKFTVQTFP